MSPALEGIKRRDGGPMAVPKFSPEPTPKLTGASSGGYWQGLQPGIDTHEHWCIFGAHLFLRFSEAAICQDKVFHSHHLTTSGSEHRSRARIFRARVRLSTISSGRRERSRPYVPGSSTRKIANSPIREERRYSPKPKRKRGAMGTYGLTEDAKSDLKRTYARGLREYGEQQVDIWPPLWTGSPGVCCPGRSRPPWMRTSAWKPLRRPWSGMASRRS
jgi:hypothetical protein